WALGVMLVAAGAVAVVSALLLGRRVGAASEALVGVARRIGDGDSPPNAPRPAAPQELARLHHELELTSRRLEQARTREHALDSSRRDLAARVSHDLRTPLAAIRATVDAPEAGLVDHPA